MFFNDAGQVFMALEYECVREPGENSGGKRRNIFPCTAPIGEPCGAFFEIVSSLRNAAGFELIRRYVMRR